LTLTNGFSSAILDDGNQGRIRLEKVAAAIEMHGGERATAGVQRRPRVRASNGAAPTRSNGHRANGYHSNGHSANGHSANGHSGNGHSANGHSHASPSAARCAASASRWAAVRSLLRAYHRHGDVRARDALIQQYLPLVRRLARRHAGRGEQLEDLVQVGSIGLIKAIDRFQIERGVDLASFAIPTIEGEIKRHLRDRAWPIRIPRRLQDDDPTLKVRVAELVDGRNGEFEQASSLEPGYARGEDRATLAEGFRVLDERERILLRLAFFDGLSQAAIGQRVGISQIHVSRLTRRALAKLRAEIG
jgi:RNA polymerase sigma-B factor